MKPYSRNQLLVLNLIATVLMFIVSVGNYYGRDMLVSSGAVLGYLLGGTIVLFRDKVDYSRLRKAIQAEHDRRVKGARDSLFQREDLSWGWYDETWNEGNEVKYATKEAAAQAQALYARDVLGI